MIFVARYNDGRCGIAEAENEEQERKLLQSEEMRFDPEQDQIISVRPLITPFASRWFFEDLDSDDFVEIDRLSGLLGFNVAEEVLQHEYPMIATAHATCEQEEPMFDPKADQTTPIVYNRPQLEQMTKWERNLLRRLRQAIKLELERGQVNTKSSLPRSE